MRHVEPKFHPSVIPVTEEQKAIQLAYGRITIVEANAGAAKTTSLGLKIGNELANGLPPESILVLTFTDEARDVIKERLLWLGVHRGLVEKIHIATVEEFCRGVLDAFYDAPLADTRTAEQLRGFALEALAKVSEKFSGEYGELDISTNNLALEQFLKNQLSAKARMLLEQDRDGMRLEDFASTHGLSLTHLLWIYEYERIRLGSFGNARFLGPLDATYDLARLMQNGEISHAECPSYPLVICDELHDMSESAFTVIAFLLQDEGCRFVGAGDHDQVIHGDRGADAVFMRQRFNICFPGKVQRLKLTPSFRFGPHIAMSMEKFKSKEVSSLSTKRTNVVKATYPKGNWAAGAEKAAAAVHTWTASRSRQESSAILLRGIHQSIAVETALIHSGQSYSCEGFQSFVERPETIFIRAVVAIALGNLETVGSISLRKSVVEALVTFGEIDLSDAYSGTFGGRYASAATALEKALGDISSDPSLLKVFYEGHVLRNPSGRQRALVDAVELLRTSAPDISAGDALRRIVATTDLMARIRRLYVSREEAEIVGRSVAEFVELADRSEKSLNEFSEWINNLEATAKRSRSKQSNIVVGLVATSKGKEYDHVAMVFLESTEFPKSGGVLGDEENLFYVGVTRAKQQLTLVVPENPDDQSDFVRRMALSSIKPKADVAMEKILETEHAAGIVDLNVPYEAKDKAKALGARWDAVRKTWYAPAGTNLEPLKIWIKPLATK